MAALKEYKCPCCGGAIQFDVASQQVKCPYCDTEFPVDILDSYEEELKNDAENDTFNWTESAGGDWQEGEEASLTSYICESCGGEIVTDATTAATTCPYCGSTVVMTGKLSGTLKPDYVIPFQYDKEAAKAALQKHYKGKILMPKSFKKENHIDEIKGVYVPFWLFDADTDANIRYRATKVRSWSDSSYRYTETSFYSVTRAGTVGFLNVPVDGSSKMPDDLMESVEPFRFSEAVDFKTAYLAGYLADKYDVTADQSIERANTRIKNSTESVFASTVTGYNTVTVENSVVNVHNGKAKYALYPVWLLSTTWKDQNFLFAMNGQTGKMVGNLPMDMKAFWRWFLGLTASVAAVVLLISWLFWKF